MTAREYLSQLKVLDLKIKTMLDEVAALREMVTGRGIAYDKDRVQSSPQNTQEQYIVKWVDLEGQIDEEINQRCKIISEIWSLDNCMYSRLLYERFVLERTFSEIAKSIPCGEATVYRWYNRALQSFYDKFLRDTES